VSRALAVALTAGAVLWACALPAAAAVAAVAETTRDESAFAAFVYKFSSTICHQRSDRSFALNGHQLPVCARCAGLYFSGALAAVAAWLGSSRTVSNARTLLLISAVPTALTIPVEWLGLSPLSNAVRAAAAVPLGAAAGWTFVRALRSERPR
jgi:uncharacterized membrane protein